VIFATALMLAALAQGDQLDCDNAKSQLDLNGCAHQEYERADAALNAQWKVTAAAMKEADRELDRKYDKRPGYYETLLAAQRAWLVYRDHHCAGAGYQVRGGSMESMVISACRAALTEARTKQLEDLIEEY
jgi:uncharacterized protein YecT (DUF1311 family)